MAKTNKKPLNERYRDALEALTPAQAQLAEIAAVARTTIATARAWVAGKQKPSPASMALLSAHYQMPEDQLFTKNHFSKAQS